MKSPRNVIGPPVEGDDFYGRERELLRLWNEATLQHLVLAAPRRVGKTSLLMGFIGYVRTNGRRVVYVDVQGADSELGFIERMVKAFRELPEGEVPAALKTRAANLPGRIESIKVVVIEVKAKADERPLWRREGEELKDILAGLAKAKGPGWFVLVDELPVLVKNLADSEGGARRADHFLSWCRELRLHTHGSNVRWVLCGSIGLVALANRLRLSHTINALALFRLDPFDEATARAFLFALARTHQIAMDVALADAIIGRTGLLVPHHLQIVFHEVRVMRDPGDPRRWVETAFTEAITKRGYFEPWYERLDDELNAADARHARSMLEVCAKDPAGVSYATFSGSIADEVPDARERQEAVLRLAHALRDDGYLEQVDEHWRFRSELLRAFWRRRYVP